MSWDDKILKRYNITRGPDGKLTAFDQRYLEGQTAIDKKLAAAEASASASAAEIYRRGQISPDVEKAQILWEKTKKYMPIAEKQAGMTGLGASESMRLRAQSDHLNRLNAAKRTRDDANAAAVDDIMKYYQEYVDSLAPERALLDINKAQADIEAIFGGEGDTASKNAAVREVLGRFADNPELQSSLQQYANNFVAGSEALDDFFKYYVQGEEGMTLDEYAEAAKAGSFWESLRDEDGFHSWYQAQDRGTRDMIDNYLEAWEQTSVYDRGIERKEAAEAKAAAEVDAKAAIHLQDLGVRLNEDGSFEIDPDAKVTAADIDNMMGGEFAGMSEGMKTTLGLVKFAAGKYEDSVKAADSAVLEALEALGVSRDKSGKFIVGEDSNIKVEDIQAILNDKQYANMSDNMESELASLKDNREEYIEEYGDATKYEILAAEIDYFSLVDENTNQFREGVTITDILDFLEKHPKASKQMRKNMQDALVLALRNTNLTPDEMRNMTPEAAKAYQEELARLADEGGLPNTDLIPEDLYEMYVKPERDELENVWGAYLKEAEGIANETYQKQMAGKEPIEVDGKKWYVAKSLEGDAEAFMEENKEAVNEALGGYGNAQNPNIPNGTVIEVNGAHLYFDKRSNTWKYVTAKKEKQSDSRVFITNHGRRLTLLPASQKYLNAIVALGNDSNDLEDGKIVEVDGARFISVDGGWYAIGDSYK